MRRKGRFRERRETRRLTSRRGGSMIHAFQNPIIDREDATVKNIAYYNGRTSSIEDMSVPMNDRACYFGDGVYDATIALNHVPLAMSDHIDRIYRSAALAEIPLSMPKEEMRGILQGLIDQVEGDELMLYWQVTRGTGMRGHAFDAIEGGPNLWAFVKPGALKDPYRTYQCITMEDTRFFYCNIKTLNLMPSVIAAQHAAEAGCYETIFHRGDRVTECAHSNVHILRGGVFQTAPCDELILPGITRAHIIAICKKLGIPVREEPFTLREMMEADEVFLSSSTAPTSRVDVIDGQPVGCRDEALFSAIREAYRDEMRKEAGIA